MSIGALTAAASAGLCSLASPCAALLYPAFLACLAAAAGSRPASRFRGLGLMACFLLGLGTVFLALASPGGIVGALRPWGARLGGAAALLAGLGLLTFWRRAGLPAALRPLGYAAAALAGLGFAGAWTPCVDTGLASILALPHTGGALLAAYTLGFGAPALALAVATDLWPRRGRAAAALQAGGGLLLVALGALLVGGLYGPLGGALLAL